MKKSFYAICLFSFISVSSYAQTVVPTVGVLSFSAFVGNNVGASFANSNFHGSFTGSGDFNSTVAGLGTIGGGAITTCTYAGTQVYPGAELAYNLSIRPFYYKLTIFNNNELTAPYMTCEGSQAPCIYAELEGIGKLTEIHP
jgi:hypothetical protein